MSDIDIDVENIIIGICGNAGAGKDTCADMLVEDFGFKKIAFADPLKNFCKEVFDFSDEQLWGPSECRNAPDMRYSRKDGSCLTPRFALQTLGSEWGRNCYDNIWCEYALRKAKKLLVSYNGVVISDVRFPNELDVIKNNGGKVIKITRNTKGLSGEAAIHDSEQLLKQIPNESFDDIIVNDSSLEELRTNIRSLIAKYV